MQHDDDEDEVEDDNDDEDDDDHDDVSLSLLLSWWWWRWWRWRLCLCFLPRLQNLFWQMDDDESGTLTAEEMQQLVKDGVEVLMIFDGRMGLIYIYI